MICPKCEEAKPENATTCAKCGAALSDSVSAQAVPAARYSRMAVFAFVVAVLGVVWLALLLHGPRFLERFFAPLSGHLSAIVVAVFPWVLAIVLALVAISVGQGEKKLKGLWLAWVAGILGAIPPVVLFAAMISARPSPAVRGKVSRIRTDMRSLAMALEAYFVDQNVYPAWGMANQGPGGLQTYNYMVCSQYQARGIRQGGSNGRQPLPGRDPRNLPSFLSKDGYRCADFGEGTSPSKYITSYPSDCFSSFRGATFVYWSIWPGGPGPDGKIPGKDSAVKGGVGWILVSPGPDLDYDIPGDWDVYDPSIGQPSLRLLTGTNKRGSSYTYDPTNGVVSDGDIYRVKQ